MKCQTINVQELAVYIGVSKDLIYKLVREKRIPFIKIGKRILFRVEAINLWLKEQETESLQ